QVAIALDTAVDGLRPQAGLARHVDELHVERQPGEQLVERKHRGRAAQRSEKCAARRDGHPATILAESDERRFRVLRTSAEIDESRAISRNGNRHHRCNLQMVSPVTVATRTGLNMSFTY